MPFRLPRFIHTWYRRGGPLSPALVTAAGLFGILSCFRLLHTSLYWDRITQVPGAGWLPLIALRMDALMISYLLMLPLVLMLLVPASWWQRHPGPIAWMIATCTGLLVWMELATVPFMREFDARPNRIFLEYLVNPKEVLSTVLSTAPVMTVVAIILTALTVWGALHLMRPMIAATGHWPWWTRLIATPIIGGLVVLTVRGTGHHPLNPSAVAFSGDNLTNQLALSSLYSVLYAAYSTKNEGDPAKIYGDVIRMEEREALARVAAASYRTGWSFDSPTPTLNRIEPRIPVPERPRNLVILLQESLGAEFVGCLGGLPLTPNIDALSKQGLLFTNLYATGTRTVRGIEAVWSGFLPTPGRSVVKLNKSQQGFFTVADLLGRQAYETLFVYGGESHFDSMRTFFVGNGITSIYDQTTFDNPTFRGTWGVSDEDLFTQAEHIFNNQSGPFCALVLSTSNHQPFEFPPGRFELYEQPAATVHNAMKYADHAIGTFFNGPAKDRPWFKDTVFVIIADHNTRTYGDDLVPVDKFHIPCLILGPGIPAGRFDKIASQIDLLPTVLPFVGLTLDTPLLGRDLLNLPEDDPGRAMMQFETTHGYLRGDRLVVHQPKKEPESFLYRDKRMQPDPNPDPELVQEAQAHVVLPGLLYKRQLYRLPKAESQDAGK